MSNLRSQLAPDWSGVNVGLTVFLYIVAWPLAVLMLIYIIWGKKLELDLSKPETFRVFGRRINSAYQAAVSSWHGMGHNSAYADANMHTGTPEPILKKESDKLKAAKAKLDADRRAFEAEKRAYENS